MARSSRNRRVALVIGLGIFVAAMVISLIDATSFTPSISSSSKGPSTPYVAPTQSTLVRTTCTFVDATRSTPDLQSANGVLVPSRTLRTEIRYLAGSDTRDIPLLVFAHGYGVTPDTYNRLLNAWARAGFVVAAPFFPLTTPHGIALEGGLDTEGDLTNETADLIFVTREVLAMSRTPDGACKLPSGLINPAKLVLAGHSDGANAVAALLDTAVPSPITYSAQLLLEGQKIPNFVYRSHIAVPTLMVQSNGDTCNLPRTARSLFRSIPGADKRYLELKRAHHLPPFSGTDSGAFGTVVASTTWFLRDSLGIQRAGAPPRLSSEVARLLAPGKLPAVIPPREPALCSQH